MKPWKNSLIRCHRSSSCHSCHPSAGLGHVSGGSIDSYHHLLRAASATEKSSRAHPVQPAWSTRRRIQLAGPILYMHWGQGPVSAASGDGGVSAADKLTDQPSEGLRVVRRGALRRVARGGGAEVGCAGGAPHRCVSVSWGAPRDGEGQCRARGAHLGVCAARTSAAPRAPLGHIGTLLTYAQSLPTPGRKSWQGNR